MWSGTRCGHRCRRDAYLASSIRRRLPSMRQKTPKYHEMIQMPMYFVYGIAKLPWVYLLGVVVVHDFQKKRSMRNQSCQASEPVRWVDFNIVLQFGLWGLIIWSTAEDWFSFVFKHWNTWNATLSYDSICASFKVKRLALETAWDPYQIQGSRINLKVDISITCYYLNDYEDLDASNAISL